MTLNCLSEELKKLRNKIDTYDRQLLKLIGLRMQTSENIGKLKQENNLPIIQSERWNKVCNELKQLAKSFKLSDEFMNDYLSAIHLESIRRQNNHYSDDT